MDDMLILFVLLAFYLINVFPFFVNKIVVHQPASSSTRKRKRGPTYYNRLLRLRPGERIVPKWNENGEVIQQERGKKLTSYLGMLVRCQRNALLQAKDWSKVPDEAKEKLWGLVLVFGNLD